MTHIPGAPVNPIKGQKSRFMFLGGPLDHTTRELPTTTALHVPPETYVAVGQHREKIDGKPLGRVIQTEARYYRYRATNSRDLSWFVMVEYGHNPTPSDLLDAYPYPPIV